jgi:hypothetical protein
MDSATGKGIGEHIERQLIAHGGIAILCNLCGLLGKIYIKYYTPTHVVVFIGTLLVVWVKQYRGRSPAIASVGL